MSRLVRAAWAFGTGVLTPLLILAGAAWGAKRLMETGPRAERAPRERRPLLVQVEELRRGRLDTRVEAMGVVVPAQSIELRPRVSGTVVRVDPRLAPGGLFRAGELVLEIDRADLELLLRQRESDVARARADLRLEEGLQAVAKTEFELLGQGLDRKDQDLVLREPQMEIARSRLRAAEAALAQARLDLARASVPAPFNALVRERAVNIGSQVAPSTAIATLAGTDLYWVEASVPVDQLPGIEIPRAPGEPGASVVVHNEGAWGRGVARRGRVLRLRGGLEEQGRMARLVVGIEDPLGLLDSSSRTPRLLLDSYVRLEIEGRRLEDVFVLRRPLLRQDDRVWVFEAGKLAVRRVEVVHRGRDEVAVRGALRDGDLVVTTDLTAPVEGMLLRTEAPRPERSVEEEPPADGEGN